MLLNCTRISQGCMSLRISQIRHAITTQNLFNNQLRLQTRRQLEDLSGILFRRHHSSIGGYKQPRQQQQLLSFINGRWAASQLVSRSIRRSLVQKSKGNASTPPTTVSKVRMARSEYARLLSLAKSEKYVLMAAIACLVVSSCISLSVPFVMGKIIDIVFNKGGMDADALLHLRNFSLILFGIFVIGGLANFARVYLFSTAALRIVRQLRSRIYRAILLQEVGWFDTKGTGELLNRLSNDTQLVSYALSSNVSDGLRSLAMVGAGTAMMIYTSPQLALASALVVPAVAGMSIVYGSYVRRITKQQLDKYADISKYAEERFSNVRTVKIFCREQHECGAYDRQLDEALQIGYKEACAKSIFFGLTGFSGNVIIISVLYYGGTLVLHDSLTIGALSAFILYAGYVAMAMNGLSSFYTELNKGIGATQRVWEILDREYQIPIDRGTIPLNKPLGEINFQSIYFSFPTRPTAPVLNDMALSLRSGETTAIVGRSGSGKTTIASLLLRLYDPQGGQVLLDNVDIRTLNPQWLRSHMGAVSQEPVLFSGTIRENILYGLNAKDDIDEEHLQQVVNEAHIHEFTANLPDGLDTVVGQRGIMLSGGQKQRVAIARALIKNPTIIILDEATSALDAVSEELVQQALDRLMQGRTVLTIAHRLSTIRNANQIAVLDSGRVIEQGTYDQLMRSDDGAFRDLVARQTFARSG